MHEAQIIVNHLVDVEGEPELIDVESLGPIHIADRHPNKLQFEVHRANLAMGTDTLRPALSTEVAPNSGRRHGAGLSEAERAGR